MESELATVLRAMRALFGLEGAERQREANQFLVEFARTEAAWRVGLQLLCDATLQSTTETLFFAANMIHAKARKEWLKLADSDKQSMVAMLHTLTQETQCGQRPALASAPLQNKICGILAIALCSSPAECRALLDNLLAQTAESATSAVNADHVRVLSFFVTFARCVCEEMDDAELSFHAKDALEVHVATLSGDVVRVLSDILLAPPSSPRSRVQGDALLCLRVWLKRAGMSLTRVYMDRPMLLRALIETLGQRSAHLTSCAEILCQVFKVAEYPAASLQEQALQATASGLLALRAAYESAVAAEEEEIAHAITTVIATFCETYTDWIIDGETPETVALGDFMLLLGLHRRRQIASLTLEFWLLVQEEPVAERHVFFQQEAFVRLLHVVLQQCAYPASLEEMDEFDADDLVAFRSGSQGVGDVLLAIFALLKDQFLGHIVSQVVDASDTANWQIIEVCLFAVSTVADDLKKRLLSSVLPSQAMETMVLQVVDVLFRATQPPQHVLVTTIGVKLLGQLGAWFHQKAMVSNSSDAIVSVLQYLDQALCHTESRANAAKSFMQITTSCAACLVEMVPPALLLSVVRHFSNRELQIEDRLLVVEGLVRVAAQSRHASKILQCVLDDSLRRLDQVLLLSSPSPTLSEDAVAQIVCEELQVCSKIVRFLDSPLDVAGGKELTKWVVGVVWPHVDEPVVARLGGNESAMTALFEFYSWCLQSLREDMAPHLAAIATRIVCVFEDQLFVAPLECGSIAVDVFGRGAAQNDAVLDSFRGLMGVLARIAFQVFTARGVDEAPDVLRALFDLAYRFLLYCPAAVVTAPEFGVLLELCRACVGNQHRASTSAMLTFATYLLQESRGKLAPFQREIDACVWSGTAQQLELWLDSVLLALSSKTPSVLFEPVGRLMLALWVPAFDVYGPQIASASSASLANKSEALGVQELSGEDRQRIVRLWVHYAQSPTRMAERKFKSLCSDFAKICRKELTVDTLLSYEEEEAQ